MSHADPGSGDAELLVRTAPRTQRFNGFFQQKDPVEFLGLPLTMFQQNFCVPLPPPAQPRIDEIRQAVYDHIETKARSGTWPGTEQQNITYIDSKAYLEKHGRRYLSLRFVTQRGSSITTLFRCYAYGSENLYFAADSYLLGKMNVRPVVWRALATIALLWLFGSVALVGSFLDSGGLGFLGFLLLCTGLFWLWGRVLRAALAQGLTDALRAVFPTRLVENSFELDDTFAHLKSALPAILDSLKDVGPRFDLDIATWQEVLIASAKQARVQTVNNYGSMSGVNLGGSGNTVTGGSVAR